MTPRLYSIASSIAANPDEVHLTIGAVRYNTHGRDRKGVCSVLVAERLQEGDTVPVFIQPNKHFHLPERKTKISLWLVQEQGLRHSVLLSKNVP